MDNIEEVKLNDAVDDLLERMKTIKEDLLQVKYYKFKLAARRTRLNLIAFEKKALEYRKLSLKI